MNKLKSVLVLTALCLSLLTYGQVPEQSALKNLVPKNPVATAFDNYINTPVSLTTGIPEISIPIYTLEVGSYKLPITLSYHASGVKVDDIATAAGLKWSLNAGGSIDRSINGAPDETYFFQNYKRYTPAYIDSLKTVFMTWGAQVTYEAMNKNIIDILTDEYSYSLPTGGGNMLFNHNNGKFYSENQSSDYDIETNINGLKSFVITDNNGNKFFFGGQYIEYSNTHLTGATAISDDVIPGSIDGNGVNSWKLYQIITPEKDTIKFDYELYNYNYETAKTFVYASLTPPGPGSELFNCGCGSSQGTIRWLTYSGGTYLIKKITSKYGNITFNYDDLNTADVWKRKLTNIIVSDANNSAIHKSKLNIDDSLGKLALKSIQDLNPQTDAVVSSYQFSYGSMGVPNLGDLSKDIMGYNNGAYNTSLIRPLSSNVPFTPANRDPNLNALLYGTLNEITYPTGGKTRFTYQLNMEGNIYGGGVIVSKIENFDQKSTLINRKSFSYKGFNGRFSTVPAYTYQALASDGNHGCVRIDYNSSMQGDDVLPRNYFYNEVIVTESGEDINKAQITKEIYKGDLQMYNVYKPYLSARYVYKGTFPTDANILQQTTYNYTTVEIDSLKQYIYANAGTYLTPPGTQWDGLWEYYCATHYHQSYIGNIVKARQLLQLNSTVTEFDRVNNTSISQITQYYYDSKSHFYPTRTVHYLSNGDSSILKQVFVSDTLLTGTEETARNFMQRRRIVASPIASIYSINNNHIKTSYTSFSVGTDSIALVRKISEKTGNNTLEERITFKQYDNEGNILEQAKYGDANEVYIWGYNKQYPVAKIIGSDYNTVKTYFDNSILLSNNPNEQTLRNELDKIRVALKGKALVYTYTYKLLRGLSSETDPSGQTIYYEYDAVGRLIALRDMDQKIIKTFDYQFQAPLNK
ncbi:hypothetical protein DVR12_05530 [Chitinophaga silvatica]|uniref:YD repeat-containing protein n=1 Tax=Chitinophaga silvatica TaxID=2282649 RepID=A0A3E1YDW3_9BACT|nr:RHS repeat domain-containing protein [Chitinophaga silvatica]RFS24664.1 hypothetical protein DVR12_05530 [Chitinophaga silvatica]